MQSLKESILSSTKTGKAGFYTAFPKSKNELKQMIKKEINEKGYNCDLNHIDVSKITNMSLLFSTLGYGLSLFNGDISKWDVSNVETMCGMFWDSKFNGNISKWDVSNVENMSTMFWNSNFDSDISNWKINDNCDTTNMFYKCQIKDRYKPKKNGEIIK